MNQDLKRIINETIKEYTERQPQYQSHRMEFSKKLIVFTSFIYGLSWIMAAYSLFILGEIPWELIRDINLLYGASCVSYYCKSAYENKPKIEKWGGGV